MNRLVAGAVAGAAGTTALNLTTYLDMLVRGRASSQVPTKVARQLAERAGISLETSGDEDESAADNRAQALGALLGMANGIGLGIAYAIVRSVLPRPPRWLATGVVGGAAMAGSDLPAARLGITDPATWTNTEWLADIVPHAVYGAVTTGVFDHIKK